MFAHCFSMLIREAQNAHATSTSIFTSEKCIVASRLHSQRCCSKDHSSGNVNHNLLINTTLPPAKDIVSTHRTRHKTITTHLFALGSNTLLHQHQKLVQESKSSEVSRMLFRRFKDGSEFLGQGPRAEE
jgi:hypothetical protein